MSAAGELIAALVAGGMDAAEAAGLVARAAVEMTGALTKKSPGALRQIRWRARLKPSQSVSQDQAQNVSDRNESVSRDAPLQPSQSVSKRLKASQNNGAANSPLTYLLTSEEKDLSEKKESKKERVLKKRNAPLPADWTPSEHAYTVAEESGVRLQIVEQIFRDYLKSSGKLYADYDAAFYNFLRNQRRFNGSNHAKAENPRGGSLIAAIDRQLAALETEASADFALPANSFCRLSG